MSDAPDTGNAPDTPYVATPSLRPAKQRLMRAVHQHTELASAAMQLREGNPSGSVVMTVDRLALEAGEPVAPKIDWSATRATYSTVQVSLLTSEILHHLRTTLDYVAYNLAWLDSCRRQDDTQFPIVDAASKWRSACQRRLAGVSSRHRDDLQEYQPYTGCIWTASLRELSNTDKHRFLVDTAREFSGVVTASSKDALPDPSDPSRVRLPITDFNVRYCFPENDGDVVSTLSGLLREGALVLQRFQSEFGEDDVLELSDPDE